MKASRYLKLLALCLLVVLAESALACPGCKEAIACPLAEQAQATGSAARGFGWSIIFMLGMVFSLIGFAVFKVYTIIRAEEARAAAQPAIHAQPSH